MVTSSPTLFSRRQSHPRSSRGIAALFRVLLFPVLLTAISLRAEIPDYLHVALGKFDPEAPKNWSYSIVIEQGSRKTTEHFDPSRGPTAQWTLLRMENREPTADELEKYNKYKARQAPGAMKATFQKSDIEPGTIRMVSENADQAEFTCTFRELSTGADKMLGHLLLQFTVNKHQAYVEKYALKLIAPYSPILGVKMKELVVTMSYTEPTGERPGFPADSSSHFSGSIFFIPVSEDLHYQYFDFSPAASRR